MQIDYASMDGHSVVRMLDVLAEKHPVVAKEVGSFKFASTEYFTRTGPGEAAQTRQKGRANRENMVRTKGLGLTFLFKKSITLYMTLNTPLTMELCVVLCNVLASNILEVNNVR